MQSGPVNQDFNAGVGFFVQIRPFRARRKRIGASARNLDVEAVGIVLSLAKVGGPHERNDFLTTNIIASFDRRWYRDRLLVAVVSEFICAPYAGIAIGRTNLDLANSVNHVPLQVFRFAFSTVTAARGARGDRGDNWAFMALGPFCPLRRKVMSSDNVNIQVAGSGAYVTVDVARAVFTSADVGLMDNLMISPATGWCSHPFVKVRIKPLDTVSCQ